MLIGVIVLVCAEVFSGASLKIGLWNPWTVLVTYWLYFAHFFLFTTLAVRTGRTSVTAAPPGDRQSPCNCSRSVITQWLSPVSGRTAGGNLRRP